MIVNVNGPQEATTGDNVTLMCSVYGYLRDLSGPNWTFSGVGHKTMPMEFNLSEYSVSYTDRIKSNLTIINMTEEDFGVYTCSVEGNETTFTLQEGKFAYIMHFDYTICKPSYLKISLGKNVLKTPC